MSSENVAGQIPEELGGFIKLAPGAFSVEEISQLIEIVDQQSTQGSVGEFTQGKVNEKVRRSRVTWLNQDDFPWVYDRMAQLARTTNARYQFEISGFQSNIQISLYDQDEQGFYDWHMDVGPQLLIRKISISIPLNDDTEYEGGRLEFQTGTRVITPDQRAGTAVIFPSFVLHRVTPVTRGKRYSMVVWIKGPAWR